MNHHQKHLSACLIALAALFSTAPIQGAFAAVPPSLGTASTFGALGGAGVTCTIPNPALPFITVTGDVGSLLDPSSVTGFPPQIPALCTLTGTVYANDTAAVAATAFNDVFGSNLAYDQLAAIPCPSVVLGHNLSGDLGGKTLAPGVYCISGVVLLASTLTLDPNATGSDGSGVWIFKSATPTTSLTPKGGSVVMAGSGNACNVYWQVSTAVDLLNTAFVGNVLAGTAISFTGQAPPGIASSLKGRALAKTAVTMTGASITSCGATQNPSCDKDHDGKGKDCDGHDKDHDKDKDHKDDSRHSFKDGGNPFDKDEHGDKK
jgi:hypothetical protein